MDKLTFSFSRVLLIVYNNYTLTLVANTIAGILQSNAHQQQKNANTVAKIARERATEPALEFW